MNFNEILGSGSQGTRNNGMR